MYYSNSNLEIGKLEEEIESYYNTVTIITNSMSSLI